MERKLELIIKGCENCPYCQYDGNYGMSYDSGTDCEKLHKRIADNYEITKYNKKLREWEKQNVSLFKSKEDKPIHPFVTFFEQECPLPKID